MKLRNKDNPQRRLKMKVEELIEKLARRDLFGKYEKNDIEKMDYISINEKIDKEADKYVKEIDRNGIKNIGIIK